MGIEQLPPQVVDDEVSKLQGIITANQENHTLKLVAGGLTFLTILGVAGSSGDSDLAYRGKLLIPEAVLLTAAVYIENRWNKAKAEIRRVARNELNELRNRKEQNP